MDQKNIKIAGQDYPYQLRRRFRARYVLWWLVLPGHILCF